MAKKSYARQQRDKLRKGLDLDSNNPVFVAPPGTKMPLRYMPGNLTMEEQRWLIKAKGLDMIDILNLHVPAQQKELAIVAERMGIPKSYVQLTQADIQILRGMPQHLRDVSYDGPTPVSDRELQIQTLLQQSVAEQQVIQDQKDLDRIATAGLAHPQPTPLSSEELQAQLTPVVVQRGELPHPTVETQPRLALVRPADIAPRAYGTGLSARREQLDDVLAAGPSTTNAHDVTSDLQPFEVQHEVQLGDAVQTVAVPVDPAESTTPPVIFKAE